MVAIRICNCPLCGQEKWKYLGQDLPWEPPCTACCRLLVAKGYATPDTPAQVTSAGRPT